MICPACGAITDGGTSGRVCQRCGRSLPHVDALIEQLAEAEYEANVNRRVLHLDWAQLPEYRKQRQRERVKRRYWPLIVKFVGEWLAGEDYEDAPFDEAVVRGRLVARSPAEMGDA